MLKCGTEIIDLVVFRKKLLKFPQGVVVTSALRPFLSFLAPCDEVLQE